MLTSVQERACRALRKQRDRPLVLIADRKNVKQVRSAVGVTLPAGSQCFESTWRTPEGSLITVRSWEDQPPSYPGKWDLVICHDGKEMKPDQVGDLNRWRDAHKSAA